MHEWSLASSIVSSLDRFVRENNIKRVLRVTISLPQLAMLDKEILTEAYRELSKGSPLEGSELIIEEEPPHFICRNCNREFTLEEAAPQLSRVLRTYGEENPLHFLPDLAPMFVKCPYCGSENIIVKNTEIKVRRVEGV